jgi:hypothetical protein
VSARALCLLLVAAAGCGGDAFTAASGDAGGPETSAAEVVTDDATGDEATGDESATTPRPHADLEAGFPDVAIVTAVDAGPHASPEAAPDTPEAGHYADAGGDAPTDGWGAPGVCGPWSCPTGCCTPGGAGECNWGTTTTACGPAGGTCHTCSPTQNCAALPDGGGVCTP